MNTSCSSKYRAPFAFLTATAALLLAGCFPSPPADDEGHTAFAHEAIPLVLGRPARGVDEIEAVADIAQYLGRDTAARMLMEDPAYVDHWADVLVDLLRMQRDTRGGVAAQDDDCWGEPTLADPDPAIAEWIRDHGPQAAGAPTGWNMTDLLRSAIALDDLSPLYRANLFTMSMRRAGNSGNGARDSLTTSFLSTYLNRDPACLKCHNPTYSTSNKEDASGDIVWRRLWTIPGHPEQALLGDYNDPVATFARVAPIWRSDVRKPGTTVGIRPWGVDEECLRDTNTRAASNNANLEAFGFQTLVSGSASFAGAAFGSLDGMANPKVSLWELEQALHDGVDGLRNGYERSSPGAGTADEDFCAVIDIFAQCSGCHGGLGGLSLDSSTLSTELINVNTEGANSVETKRVVPGNLDDSELWKRINSTDPAYKMPQGSGTLSNAEKNVIGDWILAGAPVDDPSDCNASQAPEVDRDEAFAFLTAANLVDGIWYSAMGHRLTIDHGFPRDRRQRDMLWNLTEHTFLKQDWSLKSVLAKIVRSKWYARRAPVLSQGDTAYEMHPILDNWVVADPSEVANPSPHERANGQGELVDRYLVNRLLQRIAGALSWKEPRTFPGGGYPSPLDRDLGQYLSPSVPGFSGINFQSLLALESQIGLCSKAGRALGTDDWIDALVDGIETFNTENPSAPITLGEAWSILKDRLVQDPTIETALPSALRNNADAKTEEQAVIALLDNALGGTGVGLHTPTDQFNAGQLNSALREGCGTLVKTPQFLLTGITPRGYSDNNMPDPPRLNVCLDGEQCGYSGACGHWRSRLWGMGKPIACLDRTVSDWRWYFFPGVFVTDLVFELSPVTPIEQPFRLPGELRPIDFDLAVAMRDNQEMADLSDADVKKLGDIIPLDQRAASLCPKAICGFVRETRTEQCLEQASPQTCGRLLPSCDPRPGNHIDFCNQPQVDLYEEGVFVLWAEDASVQKASGVRIMRAGQWRWRDLQADEKLQAGDLLDVPLTADLQIRKGDITLGSAGLHRSEIGGVRRHLLSISGPQIGRVLAMPNRPGVLSVEQLRRQVESGAIESRAPTRREWQRILTSSAKPWSFPDITPEEIRARNEDFEGMHVGTEDDELTDVPEPDKPDPGTPDDPDDGGVFGALWWLLLFLIIAGVVYLLFRRMIGN